MDKRIEHLDMDYYIFETDDGGFDVRDAAGRRPAGLRAQGPWNTAEEAENAVRSMTAEEAKE